MKFVHKKSGRIVDYPDHFATAKVAKNFRPLIEEVEEEKVVLDNSPSSLTRIGKRVKDAPNSDTTENED